MFRRGQPSSTRSRKICREDPNRDFVYSPLKGRSDNDKESEANISGDSAQAEYSNIAWLQIPSTPLPNPPHTVIPHSTPPPPVFDMANSIKMQNFKGVGNEGTEKFWFVAETVWKAQHITDDDVKKVQLATEFQECAL